jgi:hypothetical protein
MMTVQGAIKKKAIAFGYISSDQKKERDRV